MLLAGLGDPHCNVRAEPFPPGVCSQRGAQLLPAGQSLPGGPCLLLTARSPEGGRGRGTGECWKRHAGNICRNIPWPVPGQKSAGGGRDTATFPECPLLQGQIGPDAEPSAAGLCL